ncbi:MAG: molybdopterin-dependent oxidoreductase [Saprospiraceae bacterium]|nr:molybdopterin-dependent oxidoreductase [Saprospiraceae bacterium]
MTKQNIDRRSFLKVSGAATGGVLFGFSWLVSCQNEVQAEIIPELEMPEQWFSLNGYIKIGDNGVVTIMAPNPEIGQNVKTSMPMIVAEELDADWNKVVVEQAPLDPEKFPRQVAGGSQSIRQSWEGLRKAGATAKAMLVAAAAEKWGVDAATLKTEKGHIINANGEKIHYGEVATAASQLEVPEDAPLKDPKDFTIIGQSKKNVDLKDIITGEPLFGLDTKVEGMKYAVVLRPPAFGQKLQSVDDAAAKALTGVESVLQFGDKVAVLANSTWAAMQGKKALTAVWTEDTPLESTTYHDEELAKLLTAKTEAVRHDGNVDRAFAEADEIVERVYESPFLPHNCMEPMNFFAHVTDEKVLLDGPIQTPQWTRQRVADLLEREAEQVEVKMTRMGGGFGRRLYGDFALEAAEVSKLAKAPVQLVFSREDDMSAGTYRMAIKYKIKAAIKDKKITAYHLTEAAINSNMYGLIPNFFPAGAIENYRVDNAKMESNITTGAWRAPYTNFLAFAEQSFFDELSEKMEVDAVQLRLDLLENAKKNKEDERMQWSPDRMQECIKLVAEKAGWSTPKEGVFQGLSAYYSHNTHVAEIAEVVMKENRPVVTKVYCAVDCGIVVNPEAAKNQIEGGIIDGVGHAMFGDLAFNNGIPSATNFDKFRLIRHQEAPEIEVFFIQNNVDPTGLGEPSLPPAGGAIANAIYKATGKRFYKQPFVQEMDVLG